MGWDPSSGYDDETGGVGGLASAVGVLLGGLLTEGPGWRWVMFVNPDPPADPVSSGDEDDQPG